MSTDRPLGPTVILAQALAHLRGLGRPRSFPAGAQLMRQGEAGDTLYLIERGRVRVQRQHPHLTSPLVLAELGPGETVGEMAALDGGPRSATVVAVEGTETLELDADALRRTMARYPGAATALLQVLTQRLRSTDELAEELLKQQQERS